ncbi:MAG: hypothetical protein WD038_08870, partial [Balneolales bacterium]
HHVETQNLASLRWIKPTMSEGYGCRRNGFRYSPQGWLSYEHDRRYSAFRTTLSNNPTIVPSDNI